MVAVQPGFLDHDAPDLRDAYPDARGNGREHGQDGIRIGRSVAVYDASVQRSRARRFASFHIRLPRDPERGAQLRARDNVDRREGGGRESWKVREGRRTA